MVYKPTNGMWSLVKNLHKCAALTVAVAKCAIVNGVFLLLFTENHFSW